MFLPHLRFFTLHYLTHCDKANFNFYWNNFVFQLFLHDYQMFNTENLESTENYKNSHP